MYKIFKNEDKHKCMRCGKISAKVQKKIIFEITHKSNTL